MSELKIYENKCLSVDKMSVDNMLVIKLCVHKIGI
jgi:hypothetical protein